MFQSFALNIFFELCPKFKSDKTGLSGIFFLYFNLFNPTCFSLSLSVCLSVCLSLSHIDIVLKSPNIILMLESFVVNIFLNNV